MTISLRYKNELLELFAFLSEGWRRKVAPLLEVAFWTIPDRNPCPARRLCTLARRKILYSDRQYAGVARKIAALYPDRKIVFTSAAMIGR